jgi:hypothetical protein
MAGSALGRQGVHVFADDAQHHFIGTATDGGQSAIAVQT